MLLSAGEGQLLAWDNADATLSLNVADQSEAD